MLYIFSTIKPSNTSCCLLLILMSSILTHKCSLFFGDSGDILPARGHGGLPAEDAGVEAEVVL